jgi:hypothetical protein
MMTEEELEEMQLAKEEAAKLEQVRVICSCFFVR